MNNPLEKIPVDRCFDKMLRMLNHEVVAATGKQVIVVSLSGSAIALTWAKEHAAAIVQAWYPGLECGTAIANTLAGINNLQGGYR